MRKNGFTLIEILVVVSIFAFLGIIITRSIILSVGGSKKSESLVKIRENLDYSVGIMERQIRNANSIVNCSAGDSSVLNYIDQNGNAASFSCITDDTGHGYVASGSAQLTASGVNIVSCSLNCIMGASASPDSIQINLEAQDASASGTQNADVTISTQVSLRNY